ncbi:MAG UNVERIFIED_CONTAM: dTMP kinase [Rickettsiaceae bacterium]|jgi:dTMP kinase
MTKPLFITFEGGEGSGKTTQSKMLFEYYQGQNIPSIWTREPGGNVIAEKIRELIIYNDMDVKTELLLALAARSEHLKDVILPALKEGKIVICDRFVDSSMCYQGYKLGMEKVLTLHKEVFGDIMPDITFFIDVPVEIGLKRAISRGSSNRFENMPQNIHEKFRECFHNLVKMFPDRIVKVDGTSSPEEIFSIIIKELKNA